MEYKRDKIIVYEDDASRFITGFGVFKNANARNSIEVLKRAIEEWGKPKQIISDHGVQFTSLPRKTCENPQPNEFQKFLENNGIKHIKARIKHPQSNGKIERLFQTLKRYYRHFRSWEETVRFYNFKRPHMSLETKDRLRTPYQALMEKRKV